jgi:hypothetical protein
VEARAGEYNSQIVANTLWALATMGTKPGAEAVDGAAGAAGGGDIRGVQLVGYCKHAVGVCDDGGKAGGAADGAAGAAGGGGIRGIQLAAWCKHAVGLRDDAWAA